MTYKYKKKNSKIPFESESNHQFLLSLQRVGMRQICIQIGVYNIVTINENVPVYINFC